MRLTVSLPSFLSPVPKGSVRVAGKLANQHALPTQLPIMFKDGQRQSNEIHSYEVSKILGKECHFYWEIILLINIRIAINQYIFLLTSRQQKPALNERIW